MGKKITQELKDMDNSKTNSMQNDKNTKVVRKNIDKNMGIMGGKIGCKKKKFSTTDDHPIISLCDALEASLTDFYKQQRSEIKKIKREYKKFMTKNNMRKNPKDCNAGIHKKEVIPKSLSKLFDVDDSTTASRSELGGKFNKLFKSRGLVFDKDKRIMRVDDELAGIFGVDLNTINGCNNIGDAKTKGICILNIQKHIKQIFESNKENNNENVVTINEKSNNGVDVGASVSVGDGSDPDTGARSVAAIDVESDVGFIVEEINNDYDVESDDVNEFGDVGCESNESDDESIVSTENEDGEEENVIIRRKAKAKTNPKDKTKSKSNTKAR
jgi:hypothetical protein